MNEGKREKEMEGGREAESRRKGGREREGVME